MTLLRSWLLALLLLAAAPLRAAEPVAPAGSAFGLAPPPGYALATGYAGFDDQASGGNFVLTELPAAAFADVERGLDKEGLASRGIQMDRREPFQTPAGNAVLITGRQDVGGRSFAKWMLAVQAPDATGLVVVSIPGAVEEATDAAVRASLATLRYRAVPLEEKVAALPFRITEGETMRVASTMGGSTVLLAPGGQQGAPGRPLLVAAYVQGPRVPPAQQAAVASELTRRISGVSDIVLEAPVVLGPTVELQAAGIDGATRAPLRIAQWITFHDTGYLRTVAMAPTASFDALLPEFRRIASSIARR